MMRLKIADIVFDASVKYRYSVELCKNYLYDGCEQPEFTAIVTESDILNEKALAPEFHDAYLESLALFRKLCDYTLSNKNGIIFHSSAIYAITFKIDLFDRKQ